MVGLLDDIPLLANLSPAARREVEAAVQWYSLPGGWPLFQEGDVADRLWFVRSGSLGAFRRGPDGRTSLLGHIRAGEPVGEMALVAGEPHTASVHALRDSELLAMNRPTFDRMVTKHPALMQALAKTMLTRARQNAGPRSASSNPRVYALLSTSPTIDLRQRALELRERLIALGKSCVIVGEEAVENTSQWFDDIERWNDVVLLITPIGDSPWCRLVLRQADRIWVLARSDARPSAPLLPEDPSPARQFRLVDVVLLHHFDTGSPSERTAASVDEWLRAADAVRVFHWRDVRKEDCGRLARTLCGLSVGLVLGGGGARAFAHVGAIRAIHEFGLPIDFVGGTSMGGVIGASLAMGWSDDEIENRIWKAFVESNPLSDYVLPVIAMTRGQRVNERIKEHFGETVIEDMALPFFCVSTNLSAGTIRIHRTGALRKALRATISLPGILPPVVDGQEVLVDGAVMNNFPADVMQAAHRGPSIGIDVTHQRGLNAKDFIDPPGFFRWVISHGFSAAPPIAGLLMRAATVGVDLSQMRKKVDVLIMPELSGVDLRDWKAYDTAVEAGYRATVEALRDLTGPLGVLARIH